MQISVSQVGSVHIMTLAGELDADSYLAVIERAEVLYHQEGARDLLLDLSDVGFMSSSGLVALHSIILLLRGESPLNPNDGWGTVHAMADDVDAATGVEAHVKLLQPQPAVVRTLEIAGFNRLLAMFDERAAALAAFAA